MQRKPSNAFDMGVHFLEEHWPLVHVIIASGQERIGPSIFWEGCVFAFNWRSLLLGSLQSELLALMAFFNFFGHPFLVVLNLLLDIIRSLLKFVLFQL